MFGAQLPHLLTEIPGPRSARGVESLARTECPSLTMRRARRAERSGASSDPIVWAEARGANVRDADGNVFVDMIGAFGVVGVGHAHPRVVEAVQRQVALLPHGLGDVHPSVAKLDLLEALAGWVPFESRIILGLNGADALAAALKTAVLATGRSGVLAFEGGYHGLMYGPLALCGSHPHFREPFAEQLNPNVRFVPYPRFDLDATFEALDRALDDTVGAVVVEPALGRGGLVFPPAGFLATLAGRVRERGALLVFDEIFTGFGRTGERFAYEVESVEPDLLCLGKALGGGLPISACVGTEAVMAAWGDPDREAIHTATFAGSPLSCVAASASLEVLEEEGLVSRSREVGDAWRRSLVERLGEHPSVREIRGRGLMLAVELVDGALAARAVQQLSSRGWLVLGAGPAGASLQLTPPLMIDERLLAGFTDALVQVLEA